MNLAISIIFFIIIYLYTNQMKQKRKNKNTNIKFDDEGRMVHSQQLQDAKNQRKIIRRKVSTYSRNKEFDVNQDKPLSEAEKNVLFGK